MPEQIRCPSCEAALRVPEALMGKNVKCPKCQTTFVAEMEELSEPQGVTREPAPSGKRRRPPPPEEQEEEELPPEEEEEEARPRRRRRRRRRSAEAESAVIGPAISIMIVSAFSFLLGLADLAFRLLGIGLLAKMSSRGGGPPIAQPQGYQAGVIIGGGFDILSMIVPIILLVGAIKMKNLQSFGLAVTSCILVMVPLHCCCLLGLPFGIWGLVVLNKPEVKDAFS